MNNTMPARQKPKTAGANGAHKKEIPVNKKEGRNSFPNWLPVAIIVFAALLYSPAIYNGFVYYDDNYYILDNPFIRDFSLAGIKAIFTSFYYGNYHPLTSTLYLIEYTCF